MRNCLVSALVRAFHMRERERMIRWWARCDVCTVWDWGKAGDINVKDKCCELASEGRLREEGSATCVPVITLYCVRVSRMPAERSGRRSRRRRKPKTRKFAKIFKSFSAAHFRASSMLWGRRVSLTQQSRTDNIFFSLSQQTIAAAATTPAAEKVFSSAAATFFFASLQSCVCRSCVWQEGSDIHREWDSKAKIIWPKFKHEMPSQWWRCGIMFEMQSRCEERRTFFIHFCPRSLHSNT